MDHNAIQHLFKSPPQKVYNSIARYVIRTENEIRQDKYERYYETVRKEAFLHLCQHKYYREMHDLLGQWMLDQLTEISFNLCIDLGCGVGHWTERVSGKYKDVKMVGVDLSYQLLKVAHDHWVSGKDIEYDIKENGFHSMPARGKENRNIHFVQADITNLPLKSNISELVLSILSIDRVKDVKKAISEVYRILKPGGHFLLISPFNFQFPEQWDCFHPTGQFLAAFDERKWKLQCHEVSIPYFVPLDIRNNRVDYECDGFLFMKKPPTMN